MAIQVQEFNGDILVDGDVRSESVSTNTASISGALTADFLDETGNADNQAMSQMGVTNAINNAITSTLARAYPVGAIYMSVVSTSPASLFGGTWEQLTADAYLKIVTSGAGTLGGTNSNHVIPLASMPQHNGHVPEPALSNTGDLALSKAACIPQSNRQFLTLFSDEATIIVRYAGNNRPYYPYYYGIYAWRRTA